MSNISSLFRPRVLSLAACAVVVGNSVPAFAQSAVWDMTLSNSHWFVPTAQLLAYASPKTGFVNPIPIGDQTLWSFSAATNGAFTGISTAQLAIGPVPVIDTTSIQGFVTTAGQITMVFTPIGGGTPTVGLGQMRTIDGVTRMEMQMITGDSLLITHWAYMTPYDPLGFTPPPPRPVPANSVPQWAWMAGTPWRIASPALFGTASAGRFVVTNYQNGYFWGTGLAPVGRSGGSFTLLGSVTPEGKVLFNSLSRGSLTSLYGTAAGDASGSHMVVSSYDLTGNPTGGLATISLVEPYAAVLAARNNRAGQGAAAALYRIAGTSLSLADAWAPPFSGLDNLSASGLSTAISQTLPVLAGAASQATYATQRALQQAITGRLDDVYGMDSAGVAAQYNVWLKPLGAAARQSGLDGVPGYRANGGGLAAGMDGELSPRALLGGVFAYSHQAITGGDDAVPNRLGIDAYQLGLYGAYALRPDTDVDFQLDAGINRNGENRSISFMSSAASASYQSYTGHIGVAVKTRIPMQAGLTLLPSLRLDYARVRSDAYGESGAGALSLNVDSQVYRELTVTAGLKGAYRIASQIYLNADAGVGYNALNDRLQITSSYAGGGDSFVTSGLGVSPWLYSAGAGLVGTWKDNLDLNVRYGLQASPTGFLNQTGSVALKLKI